MNGKIVWAFAQKQILLYNTDTYELAGILPFRTGFAYDLKFSGNGKLLIAGGGRPGSGAEPALVSTGHTRTCPLRIWRPWWKSGTGCRKK